MHPVKEPLRHVVGSAPWNSVVIDILGPFPSSVRRNKYILVCLYLPLYEMARMLCATEH